SEPIYDKIFTEIGESFGKKVNNELTSKIHGSILDRGLEIFCEHLKIETDMDELKQKFLDIEQEKLSDVPLTKGAAEIIQHLANLKIPLAIATSSSRDQYTLKTTAHEDLFSLFHHVMCGDDEEVFKSKPNPCIYLECAKKFPSNPDPQECLVFEDSVNGMLAGIRAGMQVIMIPEDSVPFEKWGKATIRIDSLEIAPLELFGLRPLREPEKNSCFEMMPAIPQESEDAPNETEEI
ncbi:unnamed protein product, partial [Brassicogethes aeneus]